MFIDVILGFGMGMVPPLAEPPALVARPAPVPCICGQSDQCKCEEGKCPGGCPVADPSAAAVGVHVGSSGGSGTVVASENGRSLIVTNRHVVSHYGPASIDCGGKTYPARVLATDTRADLALVLVDATLPVAELAEAEPARGTTVRQWGRDWRGQGKPIFKRGEALGFAGAREMTGAGVWESTIPSVSGDSGCGVFDDRGRLVAVNWGAPADHPGQSAVGVGDVARFLKAEALLHFPRLAAALDRKPAAAKPYTGTAWYGAGGYADAFRERDRTGKAVVLLFTDPVNCLHCQRLEAGALADSAVKEGLARTINVRVDVSTPAGADLAAKFGVTGWPRVLVYRNGKLSGDVSGNVSARELFLAISP